MSYQIGKQTGAFQFNLISDEDGTPIDLKDYTFKVTKSRQQSNVCTIHFIPKKKKRKK